eukprot:15329770-Ditylum_brightwellii.AAC.1
MDDWEPGEAEGSEEEEEEEEEYPSGDGSEDDGLQSLDNSGKGGSGNVSSESGSNDDHVSTMTRIRKTLQGAKK